MTKTGQLLAAPPRAAAGRRQRGSRCALCAVAAALLIQLTATNCVIPSEALRFQAIHMPALVQRGTNFWLACQFELERQDQQLYSVKWYHNNEEFYRLILAAQPSGSGSSSSSGRNHIQVDHHHHQQSGAPMAIQSLDGANYQQQYFAQVGANVMMSLSNATHVRLLNASLESEGQYACEISTQNLSTIRHEREVKVYVLPSSKLHVIGLRNRYALGDQVELKCVADFSKPAPILGWFINGQRISPELQELWSLELESRIRTKSNEPELVGQSLVLKFKLTSELASFLAGNATTTPTSKLPGADYQQQQQSPTLLTGRDQSQSLAAAAAVGPSERPTAARPVLVGGALELLKLQCKYKLIEVGDVTFSELLVRPVRAGGPSARKPPPDVVRERAEPDAGPPRRPRRLAAGSPAVFKSQSGAGGQIVQSAGASWPPASPRLIWQDLGRWRGPEACRRLGSLALQPDDPVILRSTSAGRRPAPAGHRQPVELGDQLVANCSTIGALGAWVSQAGAGGERGDDDDVEPMTDDDAADLPLAQPPIDPDQDLETAPRGGLDYLRPAVERRRRRRWPAASSTITNSHPSVWPVETGGGIGADRRQQARGQFVSGHCDDPRARRRGLISGRHQTSNEPEPAGHQLQFGAPAAATSGPSTSRRQAAATGGGGHQPTGAHANKQQVAYLSLGSNWSAVAAGRVSQPLAADSSASLVSSRGAPANWAPPPADQQQQREILAPPLLEWFINYHEAPISSTSGYSPELPLLLKQHPTGDTSEAKAPPAGSSHRSSGATDLGPGSPSLRPDWFESTQAEGATGAPKQTSLRPNGFQGEETGDQNGNGNGNGNENENRGADEALGALRAAEPVLPSVDYREYFANLDQRRSIEQHLELRLEVEKKHFTTADSMLRLRCSSTQALVLISESVSLKIIGLPSNSWNPSQRIWNHHNPATSHRAAPQNSQWQRQATTGSQAPNYPPNQLPARAHKSPSSRTTATNFVAGNQLLPAPPPPPTANGQFVGNSQISTTKLLQLGSGVVEFSVSLVVLSSIANLLSLGRVVCL